MSRHRGSSRLRIADCSCLRAAAHEKPVPTSAASSGMFRSEASARPSARAPLPPAAEKVSPLRTSTTAPAMMIPSIVAAMLTDTTGSPDMKFTVPSMGSTAQPTLLVPWVSPSSSPTIVEPGHRSVNSRQISCSDWKSVAVTTSVGLDFVATVDARPNDSRTSPAASRPTSAATTSRWSPAPTGSGVVEITQARRSWPSPRSLRPARPSPPSP